MGRAARFEPASERHIDELVERIRPLDRDELIAASGERVHDTLAQSIRFSFAPGAAFDRTGRLMCLFGAMPAELMGDEAAPWLVGTDALTPSALTHGTTIYLATVQHRYPRLFNYVDARNLPSIRWLRRMGFEIDEPLPFGVAGLPFHRFHKGY